MKCSDIFKYVSGHLEDEDEDYRRYPWETGDKYSMVDSLNGALREICSQRPDAMAQTLNLTLAAGTMRQSLPAGAHSLIDVICNIDLSDPSNPIEGRGIFRTELDALRTAADWWGAGSRIEKWAYNKLDNRKEFYVFPKPVAATAVRAIVSGTPPVVESPDDDFPLDDSFANAAQFYVMADMIFGDSSESNTAKASSFVQMFAQALGVKLSADLQFPVRKGGTNDASA